MPLGPVKRAARAFCLMASKAAASNQIVGNLVLAGQPGVADGRVVGAERDADACRHQGRELVLGVAAGGAGLDVAGDGDLEGDAGGGEVRQEPGVLGAADAVPDASRAQAQGIPDAARAGGLARVDRDREAVVVGEAERRGEKCRRVPGLVSREVDSGQGALVP